MPQAFRRIPLLLVLLTLLIPFLAPLHAYPLADWWKDQLAMALVTLALLIRLPGGMGCKEPVVPVAMLFAWLFALFIVVTYALLVLHSYLIRSLSPLAFLVMASLAGYVVFAEARRLGYQEVVELLAKVLWIGALLQATLGLLQVCGLAEHVPGVLVDRANPTGNIMGNIGQRNQYAHYLGWGMAATCYLHAAGKLRGWGFHLSAPLLALLMAWSGSRLVLAYAGGFILLALLWHSRADNSTECGKRSKTLAKVLLLACAYIMLAQLLLEPLSHLLNTAGVQVNGTSGTGRLMEAGFGARRRVEWEKAWQVFLVHPLFGTGWGGFAYQSVWLEAFGAQTRFAESVLFTHSHNLFAQLLAETGLIGTGIVVTALFWCLLPYFRKNQVTAENLLLIGLAMVTLGHSMFEYPLWYLPFLCSLMIVLSLSPIRGIELSVRPQLRRFASGTVCLLVVWYLVTGAPAFFALVEGRAPSKSAEVNSQRMAALGTLARNPLWAYEAEQQLSTYLPSDRHQLALKRQLFERLAAYRPFPYSLSQLAVLRALDGDAAGAREVMTMRIAAYPDTLKSLVTFLRLRPEPELQPLREMAERADKAYKQGGAEAAARTASQPEKHKALF